MTHTITAYPLAYKSMFFFFSYLHFLEIALSERNMSGATSHLHIQANKSMKKTNLCINTRNSTKRQFLSCAIEIQELGYMVLFACE